MSWFKRLREGITTSTREKKETPDGIWHKCKACQKTIHMRDYRDNLFVCPGCNHHGRIEGPEYFDMLFDNHEFIPLFDELMPVDMLEFTDLKSYKDRLEEAKTKVNVPEAISVAVGCLNDKDLVICAMNFSFIGGSMGSVMGEKISKSIDYCIAHHIPLLIISKSGGARMMEAAFSLMQMAKTSAKLTQLSAAGLPYISLMTDPTTGGVTASFAMLGDINIAEPDALIGFAGPRVIKETIKKDLPKGFQKSEFLLEKGFLDFIVPRKELKEKLTDILQMLQ